MDFFTLFTSDGVVISALLGSVAGVLGAAFSTNGSPVVMYGKLCNFSKSIPRFSFFIHCLRCDANKRCNGYFRYHIFALLAVLQLLVGKKIAELRKADASQ